MQEEDEEEDDPVILLPDLVIPNNGGIPRQLSVGDSGTDFSPRSLDDHPAGPQAELVRAFGIEAEDEIQDTAGLPSGIAVSR